MKHFYSRFLILVIIFTIAISSCNNNSEYPGFDQTENGLYYKIHKTNKDSLKPEKGDFLLSEMVVTIDTGERVVLFDNTGRPELVKIDSSLFKGDLNEGLALLRVGDSASFLIRADSLMKIFQLPGFIDSTQILIYDINVLGYKSKDDFKKDQEEKMKQQNEMMEDSKQKEITDLENYIKENNIKVKPTESGLYYIELKKGTGALAESGKTIKMNYVGRLINGKLFDTSDEEVAKKENVFNPQRTYKPIEYPHGTGYVIKGWDEGIGKMRVGGKARLIVPSSIAYKSAGRPSIPPHSTLIFDIELMEVLDNN